MKNATLSTGERALLDGNIVDNVQVMHVDMRIGEGAEPATGKLSTGRLSLAAQATRRFEDAFVVTGRLSNAPSSAAAAVVTAG
jgi:hypothetical protein